MRIKYPRNQNIFNKMLRFLSSLFKFNYFKSNPSLKYMYAPLVFGVVSNFVHYLFDFNSISSVILLYFYIFPRILFIYYVRLRHNVGKQICGVNIN